MILALIFLAKLVGEDKPSGITEWIRLRSDEFVRLFGFKHQRMPCLNIIRGVLQEAVSVGELEGKLREYLHEVFGANRASWLSQTARRCGARFLWANPKECICWPPIYRLKA